MKVPQLILRRATYAEFLQENIEVFLWAETDPWVQRERARFNAMLAEDKKRQRAEMDAYILEDRRLRDLSNARARAKYHDKKRQKELERRQRLLDQI